MFLIHQVGCPLVAISYISYFSTTDFSIYCIGCWQSKVDTKNSLPKIQFKNDFFLYEHKKIDSKYFEVEIWKHRSLHLVYKKWMDTKFEQLWYHRSRLQVRLKPIGSIWYSNLLHIKKLIYYDYNMHNLTIHKYLLGPH